MKSILQDHLRTAIMRRTEMAFQKFIVDLHLAIYGNKFVCVKQKQDGGCDGIIDNSVVVAAYGPERKELRQFKKKVKGDYDSYKKNWQSKYPSWRFIYNDELSKDRIQFLEDLHPSCEKLGIDNIINLIDGLPYSKIMSLSTDSLGIDRTLIAHDILSTIIDDLIKGVVGHSSKRLKPAYIEDKIKLNYSSEDVEVATREYEESFSDINILQNVLGTYEDADLAALRNKIVSAFQDFEGEFKIRLSKAAKYLAGSNNMDDRYMYFLRVILIYYFETCAIGRRTEAENVNSST